LLLEFLVLGFDFDNLLGHFIEFPFFLVNDDITLGDD
jgi:hypothetical protein